MGLYNFSEKKYVYLFEMDSVRNSPEEVCIGLRALYEEIMKNGNTVVLTFNQIVDSKTFLQAIYNEKNYKYIKKLFENGLIKISRFRNTRTLAQYALDSLEKNDKQRILDRFVFSVLPNKYQIKDTYLNLIDAIKYSDPNILNKNADDNVFFILKRWVEMILFLSRQEYAYHPNYTQTDEEKTIYSLSGFLDKVISLSVQKHDMGFQQIVSIDCLEKVFSTVEKEITSLVINNIETNKKSSSSDEKKAIIRARNMRSLYYKYLDELSSNNADNSQMQTTIKVSKAIIDLCYNYSNEYSILDVSPHYHFDNDMEFVADFKRRFTSYFQFHYYQENPYSDSNLGFLEKSTYKIKCSDQTFKIPKFRYPSFLAGSRKHEVVSEKRSNVIYQEKLKKQRWAWRGNVSLQNAIFGVSMFVSFLFFIFAEVIYNWFQDFLARFFDDLFVQSFSEFFSNPIVKLVLTIFITCALSWFISWLLEKIINIFIKRKTGVSIGLHLPNFAESLIIGIKTIIYMFVFWFTRTRVIQKKEKE